MSGWGPALEPNTGNVHIVPCDVERNVLSPHFISPNCPCKPEVRRVLRHRETNYEVSMYVHNDPERSGLIIKS